MSACVGGIGHQPIPPIVVCSTHTTVVITLLAKKTLSFISPTYYDDDEGKKCEACHRAVQ